MEVVEDYLLRLFICIGNVANHLVFGRCFGFKREGNSVLVAVLHLELIKIYKAPVNAARRACLKAAKRNIELFKRCGKSA